MKKYSSACILVQSDRDQEQDPQSLKIRTDNVEFVNSMEFVVAMQVLAFLIADHLGMDTGIHEPFAMMRELETSYK